MSLGTQQHRQSRCTLHERSSVGHCDICLEIEGMPCMLSMWEAGCSVTDALATTVDCIGLLCIMERLTQEDGLHEGAGGGVAGAAVGGG